MAVTSFNFRLYRGFGTIPEAVFGWCLLCTAIATGEFCGLMRPCAEELRKKKFKTLVAVCFAEGKVVGWMFLDQHHIVQMYVLPAYRGRNIASRLLIRLSRRMAVNPRKIAVYNYSARLVTESAATLLVH